jgi:hypothetical protein
VIRAAAAAFAVALWLVSACGASSASSPSPSTGQTVLNVSGRLDRGPQPTCPPGDPCDPPAVGSILAFSSPGKSDVTVRVGADGAFALHLDPGAYTIRAGPPPMRGQLEPAQVRVPTTGTVTLNLQIVPVAA